MLYKETKYSYNDISIAPAILSNVRHRKECNPLLKDGNLPIFASPMTTVVNEKNFKTFEDNGIIPILPRCQTISFSDRFNYASQGKWAAFSLSEFEEYFCNEDFVVGVTPYKVLIDIANGHMTYLYELVSKAKQLHGDNIIIMVGNVANPKTYEDCWKAGADYIRVSIGTGNGCFVKGTKILMADGTQSNIEDIDKGDYVLTKNGAYKVLNTFVKNKKETVKINNEIECTLDHKFFVIRKTDVTENMTDEDIKEKGFYIEAQYLCEDYLLVKA